MIEELVAWFREAKRDLPWRAAEDPDAIWGSENMLAQSRGGPAAFDGVAELWWDSLDDLAAATATPDGRAAALALLVDERRFIDHARSPLWVCEQHAFVGA